MLGSQGTANGMMFSEFFLPRCLLSKTTLLIWPSTSSLSNLSTGQPTLVKPQSSQVYLASMFAFLVLNFLHVLVERTYNRDNHL